MSTLRSNTSKFRLASLRFLEHLEGDGKSPLTIEKYGASLRTFEKLTDVVDVLDIDKDVVRSFKAQLAQQRTRRNCLLSVRTRNRHSSALRQLLRYSIREEDLDVLPFDRVTRIKTEECQPKWLGDEELQQLLAMTDTTTRNGMRDSAILELLFSSGLRLQEFVMLNRKAVNRRTREISIRGKRGNVRVVFLTERAVEAIDRYLELRYCNRNWQSVLHFKAIRTGTKNAVAPRKCSWSKNCAA